MTNMGPSGRFRTKHRDGILDRLDHSLGPTIRWVLRTDLGRHGRASSALICVPAIPDDKKGTYSANSLLIQVRKTERLLPPDHSGAMVGRILGTRTNTGFCKETDIRAGPFLFPSSTELPPSLDSEAQQNNP
jgi:hypothetical protein